MPVLGKVGLVNRGAYSASATYTALDFVLHNGSSYVALKGVSGITPTNDGVNWQTLAEGTAASLYLKNNLTYATAGEYALDAAQGPVIKGLIDNKANANDPTLRFRVGTNSATATDNPHVEFRGSGTVGTNRRLSLVYYGTDGESKSISLVNENGDFLPAFPPKSHASETASTYGQGDATNYGHVKLSNTYTSAVSGGNAAGGVAASQNAVYNAYANRAPISHAATATTYGLGTASNYGHTKLSDTYASKVTNGAAANGVAASQNALYNAYNTLKTRVDQSKIIHSGAVTHENVSVANNKNVNLGSISLAANTNNIIVITVSWGSNATGYRAIWFSDTAAGEEPYVAAKVIAAAASGANTQMQLYITRKCTAAETIYIVGKQNSGSTLTASIRDNHTTIAY